MNQHTGTVCAAPGERSYSDMLPSQFKLVATTTEVPE